MAKQVSSRSRHTGRTSSHQLSSKTKIVFITCWRTLWQTSWPRSQLSFGRESLEDRTHGKSVWRRGWLWCKLTFWAKREEAGDIYELDELLEPTEVSALSSLEELVGDIANTGHLLMRHRTGLRCQSCNIYRARRQLKFWSKTPCSD